MTVKTWFTKVISPRALVSVIGGKSPISTLHEINRLSSNADGSLMECHQWYKCMVRYDMFDSMFPGPPPVPPDGEDTSLLGVRLLVQAPGLAQGAHAPPLHAEAVPVRGVRQAVHAEAPAGGPPGQAQHRQGPVSVLRQGNSQQVGVSIVVVVKLLRRSTRGEIGRRCFHS